MNAAKRTAISNSSASALSQSTAASVGQSAKRQRTYQPKRKPHAGARQAIAFESSVKLTVNLLLAIVATTTIAKLLPYYQSQQARLATLQISVTSAEAKNTDLRERFSYNFDPAQASRIMQEQSGMGYPNQKQIVWTEPDATETSAIESPATESPATKTSATETPVLPPSTNH